MLVRHLPIACPENQKLHQKISHHQGDFKIGYGTDDVLKPFEFGVNMLADYESSMGILVTFNYNIGLSNSYNDGNASWKNNYFGLNPGYFIRGKK